MRQQNHGDLVVQGAGALIVFIIIYHCWVYLLGAVVVWVIAKEYVKRKND